MYEDLGFWKFQSPNKPDAISFTGEAATKSCCTWSWKLVRRFPHSAEIDIESLYEKKRVEIRFRQLKVSRLEKRVPWIMPKGGDYSMAKEVGVLLASSVSASPTGVSSIKGSQKKVKGGGSKSKGKKADTRPSKKRSLVGGQSSSEEEKEEEGLIKRKRKKVPVRETEPEGVVVREPSSERVARRLSYQEKGKAKVDDKGTVSWLREDFDLEAVELEALGKEIEESAPALMNLNVSDDACARSLCKKVISRAVDGDLLQKIEDYSPRDLGNFGAASLVQFLTYFHQLLLLEEERWYFGGREKELSQEVKELKEENRILKRLMDESDVQRVSNDNFESKLAKDSKECEDLRKEIVTLREEGKKVSVELSMVRDLKDNWINRYQSVRTANVDLMKEKDNLVNEKKNLEKELESLKKISDPSSIEQAKSQAIVEFKSSPEFSVEMLTVESNSENRRAAHIIRHVWPLITDKSLLVRAFINPFDCVRAREGVAFVPFNESEMELMRSRDAAKGVNWSHLEVIRPSFWDLVESSLNLRRDINEPGPSTAMVPYTVSYGSDVEVLPVEERTAPVLNIEDSESDPSLDENLSLDSAGF